MSEMVERVAREIGRVMVLNFPATEHLTSGIVEREIARAAIAAMREPTALMVERGRDAKDDESTTIEIWQIMIDGALKG